MLTRIHRRAHRALRYEGTALRRFWGTLALVTVMFMLGAASVRTATSRATSTALLPRAEHPAASPHTFGAEPGPWYSVVVVAQLSDCNGNLGHLAFLDRPSIRPLVRARHLLFEGASRDTLLLRPRLPPALRTASLHLLTSTQRRLLHDLGHGATPIMALFDSTDRLVMITATPDDVVARTALVRALSRLLNNDPSP